MLFAIPKHWFEIWLLIVHGRISESKKRRLGAMAQRAASVRATGRWRRECLNSAVLQSVLKLFLRLDVERYLATQHFPASFYSDNETLHSIWIR
jgi:hypothetical protein